MTAPTADDVRRALSALDPPQEKIVAAVFTSMAQHPTRARELEWLSEQLASATLLAGDFEAASADEGVARVQEYLQTHARTLLDASLLLFHQTARDLEPRAATGFTLEDAVRCALAYLPSLEPVREASAEPLSEPSPEPAATERNLGEQPLAALMAARGLQPKDLVAASSEQLTHKMVSRAMKGRRLTANTMDKVVRAWNAATGSEAERGELFNYVP